MKELDFLIDKKYIDNYKNEIPFLFDEKMPIDLSWDEIFSLADEDIKAEIDTKQDHYSGHGMKLHKADRLQKISVVVDKLLEIFLQSKYRLKERPSMAHHIYITFTTLKSLSNAPHIDEEPVFFWDVRGEVIWQIWDKESKNIEYSFSLKPGDIVYCPGKRQHNVISLSPRAGVSLAFRRLKDNTDGII
jgi:hypothetical protein